MTDFQFFNSNEAYALSGYDKFSKTYNGWETWETIELSYAESFREFDFLDMSKGIGIDFSDILKTSDGGSSWISVFNDFSKIDFFNSGNGWLIDRNLPGKMLHSSDAGHSWEDYNAGNIGNISDLSFISQSTGFAISDSSELLKTVNGGSTWDIVPIPLDSMFYSNIEFLDENVGFVVTNNSRFARTIDGGQSWNTYVFDTVNFLRSSFFFDESNGWVTGSNGLCAQTNDGGLSWDIQTIDTYYLTDIVFLDTDKGFMVSYYGELYQTNDGGVNWEFIKAFDTEMIEIVFADNQNGWLVGKYKIYHTENGGTDWDLEFEPGIPGSTTKISSLTMISPDTAWFCAETGEVYTYGLQTSISVNEQKTEPLLFPNPTSNTLNISYNFGRDNKTLNIFSMDGKMILTKEIAPWSNLVPIDVSGVKKGIYVLKIKGQKGVYKWIKQ